MITDPSAPSSAKSFSVLVWLLVYRNVRTPAATRISPINESWSNSAPSPFGSDARTLVCPRAAHEPSAGGIGGR